jgi:hypothetical protein
MRAVAPGREQKMAFKQRLAGAELGQYVFVLHYPVGLS